MNKNITNNKRNIPTKNSRSNFWRFFWITIIIFVIIYIFIMIKSELYKSNNSDSVKTSQSKDSNTLQSNPSRISQSKNGSILFSKELVKILNNILPKTLEDIHIENPILITNSIDSIIDVKINLIFDPVLKQIPKFSDFHYSLKGEYTELVLLATNRFNDGLKKELFEKVNFSANYEKAIEEINTESINKIVEVFTSSNKRISEKIGLNSSESILLTDLLNISTTDLNNRIKSSEYMPMRVTGVLGGVATAIFIKTLSKKLALKLVGKVGLKLGIKSIGVLGGAGSGALIGTVAGPVGTAVGGVVGAIAAWVATDKLVIEIDQYLHEDEFKNVLYEKIEEYKYDIKTSIKKRYTSSIENFNNDYQQRWKENTSMSPMNIINE